MRPQRRIFPNYLPDFIGPLNVMIPVTLVSGILAFLWISIHTTPGVITLVILYGFSYSAFVSMPLTVSALVGTPVAGATLHHEHNDYLGVELLTGCCLPCSSAIMIAARLIKTGPILFIRS